MKRCGGFVKKLQALLLIGWLVIGCTPLDALGAEGTQNTLEAEMREKSGRQDLLPIRGVYVKNLDDVTESKEELEEKVQGECEKPSEIKRSKIYQTDWDRYATHYYYNQLNVAEKDLWDQLNGICRAYLTVG